MGFCRDLGSREKGRGYKEPIPPAPSAALRAGRGDYFKGFGSLLRSPNPWTVSPPQCKKARERRTPACAGMTGKTLSNSPFAKGRG